MCVPLPSSIDPSTHQANLAMKINAKVGGVNTQWAVMGEELLRQYLNKEVGACVCVYFWWLVEPGVVVTETGNTNCVTDRRGGDFARQHLVECATSLRTYTDSLCKANTSVNVFCLCAPAICCLHPCITSIRCHPFRCLASM